LTGSRRRVDGSLVVVIMSVSTRGAGNIRWFWACPRRFGCHYFRMGDDGGFPVGYHNLHPDVTFNFQLNRFCNWVGEPQMLGELRGVAPKRGGYAAWARQLLAFGERALGQGRMLAGAYLIRAGEFFMSADDPRRRGARRTFLDTVLHEFGVDAD